MKWQFNGEFFKYYNVLFYIYCNLDVIFCTESAIIFHIRPNY